MFDSRGLLQEVPRIVFSILRLRCLFGFASASFPAATQEDVPADLAWLRGPCRHAGGHDGNAGT